MDNSPATTPNGTSLSKHRFLPLTGMRFFLALWVVFFHQSGPNGFLGEYLTNLPAIGFSVLRTGYLAVGMFFVLSGFVLSYNYSVATAWSAPQLIRFGVARFARVYPAYCIGLLLMAPNVLQYVMEAFTLAKLGKQAAVAILQWTLLQSWFPTVALSWNGPGWSLSNEAFFYFCFPFAGLAIWRVSRPQSLVLAGVSLWVAALAGPFLAVAIPLTGFGNAPATSMHPHADTSWVNVIKFNPVLRLPDFCVGIVLGRVYSQLRSSSYLLDRGYWLYVPGFFLELSAISYCDVLPYPLVHNGLFLPLHCLVILGLAFGGGLPAKFLSVRPVVFLGNSSYSMYILHGPLAFWFSRHFGRLYPATLSAFDGMLLYLSVVVTLSAILFVYFEEPANRILKAKLKSWFEAPPQASRKATALY